VKVGCGGTAPLILNLFIEVVGQLDDPDAFYLWDKRRRHPLEGRLMPVISSRRVLKSNSIQ
jgi:hypothetical protein